MKTNKMNINDTEIKINSEIIKPVPLGDYDNYFAFDYSQKVTAVARMTKTQTIPKVIEFPTNLKELKLYFSRFTGTKIITIEETTNSQHLFVELYEYADKILVCDPWRNRLLNDGPKTDKMDAVKLCKLLKAGLLKEVYHTLDKTYELRKIVSAYDDLIQAGVRLKNQKSALFRSEGLLYKKDNLPATNLLNFISAPIEESIEMYEVHKENYNEYFSKSVKKDKRLKNLLSVPGIGEIGAVTIMVQVIDGKRFKKGGHYLSYCGLVKHEKLSGGRSYGRRNSRYNRKLKKVYKIAALAAIGGDNIFKEYYNHLLSKGLAEFNARHSVARLIARVTLGILKHETKFDPELIRRNIQPKKIS